MSTQPSRPSVQVTVRLPEDLWTEVAVRATEETRSVSATIVHLVRKALRSEPAAARRTWSNMLCAHGNVPSACPERPAEEAECPWGDDLAEPSVVAERA